MINLVSMYNYYFELFIIGFL